MIILQGLWRGYSYSEKREVRINHKHSFSNYLVFYSAKLWGSFLQTDTVINSIRDFVLAWSTTNTYLASTAVTSGNIFRLLKNWEMEQNGLDLRHHSALNLFLTAYIRYLYR